MPLVLKGLSRRELLGASLAAAAGAAGYPWLASAEEPPVDLHYFALLSDTHIPADKLQQRRGIRPWDHFVQVRNEVLAMSPQPAAVLVCGDCAYLKGLPADYARFVEAVKPLRDAGLTLHLALGNHDRHANFRKALAPTDAQRNDVPDRYVGLVRTPRANWLLLDSLDDGRIGYGKLGDKQLEWLQRTLDANPDRPALIMVHHHPDPGAMLRGLVDTKALMAVLTPRKQVKAWIYGHTHLWGHSERDGIHFINLPTTAWLMIGDGPAGWVTARLGARGATFEMVALDKQHPRHGEKLDLTWR